MIYLFDTDWFIDYLGDRAPATRQFDEIDASTFSLSVASLGELLDGVNGSRDPVGDRYELDQALRLVTLLDIDPPIAEIFGELRSLLRRTGKLIADLDLLIAATALRHDLTLVTRNRRHFDRIPGLQLHEMV